MLDPARLRSLLDRLREAESQLGRLRELGRDDVRDDVDRLNSVKYLYVVAAEAGIDAGQHVIATSGLRAPSTYAGVFTELGRVGVLSAELARSLESMARFRNLLVHGYADVDDDLVLDVLHGGSLEDLARLRTELACVLEDETDPAD
jgi:uncharacterized protein YutE (UPF0331/DUF86 family)